jgi:hypothetical protein
MLILLQKIVENHTFDPYPFLSCPPLRLQAEMDAKVKQFIDKDRVMFAEIQEPILRTSISVENFFEQFVYHRILQKIFHPETLDKNLSDHYGD